jgi:hypothetical protein
MSPTKKNKNFILFLLVMSLGVLAAVTHFLWVTAWLAPLFIYIFSKIAFRPANVNLQTPIKSTIGLYFGLYLILYLFLFEFRDDLLRSSFLWRPDERQYIEGVGYFLNYACFIFGYASCHYLLRVSKIKLFLLVCFFSEILLILTGIFSIDNPQYYSYLNFSLVPLLFLDKICYSGRIIYLYIAISFCTQLFLFGNRFPSLALVFFAFCWYIYPFFLKRKIRHLFWFVSFFVTLNLMPFLYQSAIESAAIASFNSTRSNDTNSALDKGLDGRLAIWPDIINSIVEKPFLGQCSNCSTEYFSNWAQSRNISSHNTYLEILFRSGLVGLICLLLLFYSISKASVTAVNISAYSRFLFSYISSCMVFMSSNEFGFTQTFVANAIFWLIIGVCSGKANAKIRQ